MPVPRVIDMSHWQRGPIDFHAVAAVGIRGVVHLASMGSNVQDAAYAENRVDARRAGLEWGAVHSLAPGDMDDQVDCFLRFAKPGDETLLAVAHEDKRVSLTDLKQFLTTLRRRAARNPVLCSGTVIRDQLGTLKDADLATYRLWIMDYTTEIAPEWPAQTWPTYWLWQFANNGRVPGIAGDVFLSGFGPRTENEVTWGRRPIAMAPDQAMAPLTGAA